MKIARLRVSKFRNLLSGALWTYSAQGATVVIQVGYAAITSRFVDPVGFADYGVALAVVALANLVTNGGIAQAVGRMAELETKRIRGLASYGLLLGLAGGVFIWVTADIWATFWGAPGAASPIRWLAVGTFLAPITGLCAGLLRRQGRFRSVAMTVFMSNVMGMLLGVAAVSSWGTSTSLIVSVLTAQVLTTIGCFASNRKLLSGLAPPRSGGREIQFSWKLTFASLLPYFNGNVGKWAVTNFLAPGSLGHWNRADVISTVPLMQIQNALIQTIYPEFRHDVGGAQRTKQVWTDLLVLTGWLVLPGASIVSVFMPHLVSILFGPGWSTAASLVAPLTIIGALQVSATLLASAVEALAKFTWIWATNVMLTVVYVSAAVGVAITHEWYPLILGLLFAIVVQHALHIFLCARENLVDIAVLGRAYFAIMAVSGICAGLMLLSKHIFERYGVPSALIFSGMLVGLILLLLIPVRQSFPPYRIARKYRML